MAPFFAIGFLVAKQIDYVVELLQHVLSSQRLPAGAAEVASDLPKLVCNAGAVESLSGLGLQSVGELAKATALTLYLNLPQPIGVINGWLDEALLHYYFENFMDRLRSVGIQRFTQLIDLLAPGLPTTAGTPRAPENIVWTQPEETKITGTNDDLIIARAVIGIVRSRTHHWTFAMIWDAYAEAFSRPQKPQEVPLRAAA
jgi:hypothetical protein